MARMSWRTEASDAAIVSAINPYRAEMRFQIRQLAGCGRTARRFGCGIGGTCPATPAAGQASQSRHCCRLPSRGSCPPFRRPARIKEGHYRRGEPVRVVANRDIAAVGDLGEVAVLVPLQPASNDPANVFQGLMRLPSDQVGCRMSIRARHTRHRRCRRRWPGCRPRK